MKKTKTGIILLIVLLVITSICYGAENDMSCNVTIETESTTVTQTQKLVKIDITLADYQGDGILGYEGKLEYDKNVFETVTITALNDWDKVTYEKETGKIVSTTTTAQKNTKIAQITLELKNNITVEKAEVTLSNFAFSDGNIEKTFQKTITYNFPYNVKQNTTEDKNNTNNNGEQKKPVVPEIDTSTNTNPKQDPPKQLTVESTNKATTQDNTKAQTNIPQTGATPMEVISIVGIIILAIFGYGKYRSIHLK